MLGNVKLSGCISDIPSSLKDCSTKAPCRNRKERFVSIACLSNKKNEVEFPFSINAPHYGEVWDVTLHAQLICVRTGKSIRRFRILDCPASFCTMLFLTTSVTDYMLLRQTKPASSRNAINFCSASLLKLAFLVVIIAKEKPLFSAFVISFLEVIHLDGMRTQTQMQNHQG